MPRSHFYGEGVSGFDQTFGQPMREFIPTLVHLARLDVGHSVLDIATGTGFAAEAALSAVGPSGHVTAVDDTPPMLEQARKRLGGFRNASFATQQATALTFADVNFDAVLCSMALMIFADRARALSEFHRVLKEGGRLAVSINTRPDRSLTGHVRVAVARYVPAMATAMAHHYSLSDEVELRKLLEHANFRDVAVIRQTRRFSFPS